MAWAERIIGRLPSNRDSLAEPVRSKVSLSDHATRNDSGAAIGDRDLTGGDGADWFSEDQLRLCAVQKGQWHGRSG